MQGYLDPVRILFRKFQSEQTQAEYMRRKQLESYLESFKDSLAISFNECLKS